MLMFADILPPPVNIVIAYIFPSTVIIVVVIQWCYWWPQQLHTLFDRKFTDRKSYVVYNALAGAGAALVGLLLTLVLSYNITCHIQNKYTLVGR